MGFTEKKEWDTLQKMTNSLLVNVDIPIDTKRL